MIPDMLIERTSPIRPCTDCPDGGYCQYVKFHTGRLLCDTFIEVSVLSERDGINTCTSETFIEKESRADEDCVS